MTPNGVSDPQLVILGQRFYALGRQYGRMGHILHLGVLRLPSQVCATLRFSMSITLKMA